MSHNKLMRRQNLPRGYFKKRKHNTENVRPPDDATMPRKSSFSMNFESFVNIRTFWKVLLVLNLCVAKGLTSTTLDPFSVVGLPQLKSTEVANYEGENGSKSELLFVC